jgi:hypothetical protein
MLLINSSVKKTGARWDQYRAPGKSFEKENFIMEHSHYFTLSMYHGRYYRELPKSPEDKN